MCPCSPTAAVLPSRTAAGGHHQRGSCWPRRWAVTGRGGGGLAGRDVRSGHGDRGEAEERVRGRRRGRARASRRRACARTGGRAGAQAGGPPPRAGGRHHSEPANASPTPGGDGSSGSGGQRRPASAAIPPGHPHAPHVRAAGSNAPYSIMVPAAYAPLPPSEPYRPPPPQFCPAAPSRCGPHGHGSPAPCCTDATALSTTRGDCPIPLGRAVNPLPEERTTAKQPMSGGRKTPTLPGPTTNRTALRAARAPPTTIPVTTLQQPYLCQLLHRPRFPRRGGEMQPEGLPLPRRRRLGRRGPPAASVHRVRRHCQLVGGAHRAPAAGSAA